MKTTVNLIFEGWKADSEKPTLNLSATEDDLNVATIIVGTATIGKSKMYEILRAAQELGKKPIFVLEITD